jgi:hypothetical protein
MSDDQEDWATGSSRAIDEHDPAREPYASMSRDEIRELMQAEGLSGYQFEMLNQHLMDKCTVAELEQFSFIDALSVWLMRQREVHGNDQAMHCRQVALEASIRMFKDMPAPGPLHEIN